MSAMKKKVVSLEELRRQFEQSRRRLGQLGYISQGSVQDRTARPGGGAGYQWTRKVAGKTITVALTAPQFQAMRQAVANHRQLRRDLAELEKISRRIMFQSSPHPARRKFLTNRVLGLN
jgi:hypothetical protein